MIDTHKTVLILEKAGFSKEQAETLTGVVTDSHGAADLVTKADLFTAAAELKKEIADSKVSIMQWVVGLFLTQTALLIAAWKLLP